MTRHRAVVVGMAAQGIDLLLTEYAGENWRATFFVTGVAYAIVKLAAIRGSPRFSRAIH